jgi:hypothetical protein
MVDNPAMPRYSFSLDKGIPAADSDATEDFADNHAAMDHANLIAKDLARSLAAKNNSRVVVRNEAGDEIGDVPLRVDLR